MIFAPALLFCPGDRPDRYAKAAAGSDGAIIDLEDAVAPDRKAFARASLLAADLDPQQTVVRVNPVGTEDFARDLDALARTGFRTVMLAKTESAADAAALGGYSVLALCESARGVENAGEIAASANVFALMWGAEDLVASLGGRSSRGADGTYREFARYARSRVLIAAASHNKQAYDAVHLDITDQNGLRIEAQDAAASGFVGTACIHPSQVGTVRAAFAPTADELAWAHRVLEAAATARSGVFVHDGRMIDEPVLRQARRTLAYGA